jgi:dual specificity protein kinase CLK2/3
MSTEEVLSCVNLSEDKVPIDDRHGHLICRPGAKINERYRIVKKLGKGHFARVVEVIDEKRNKKLALKIMKNKKSYRRSAKEEIKTLRYLSYCDPNNTSLCVKMITSFEYNGHLCIAFEALGKDIFDFLAENHFQPFKLDQIRHMAYQLCYSVNFLHTKGIIHTDLKTDNLLFLDSSYTEQFNAEKNRNIRLINRTDIRLIDFGCSVDDETFHSFTASNRYYRAPEIILKMRWNRPIDIWSIACILFELHTGNLLFNTEDNDLEHLGIMEKVLGTIPHILTENHKYFPNGKLHFDWSQKSHGACFHPLRNYMKSKTDDEMQLFDLIEKMLAYEPLKRITAEEALKHPFFDTIPSHQRLN